MRHAHEVGKLETAQNTTSGLDPTTAEYNYRYGSSGAWEGWQDVESYDAGPETTDPVTLYADAIPYTGESQTAFQVQFRIENYASSLMTSTVHSVRVDNVPPSGSIEINDGDSWTNSASVTLGLSASDSGAGLDGCELVYQEGEGSWQALSTSCSGTDTFTPTLPRVWYTFPSTTLRTGHLTATVPSTALRGCYANNVSNTAIATATASVRDCTKYYYLGAQRVAMRDADGDTFWLHGEDPSMNSGQA